jgi:hypothetical protein
MTGKLSERLRDYERHAPDCICLMCEAATALDAAETALMPFGRLAEIGENLADGASTLVNINRCREAAAALALLRGKP